MQLLEREATLGSLTEYAAEARAGDPRLVLLAGEAGVGKTSVVEALAEQTPDARWLWGRCDGSFTPEPLSPLYDVASAVGGSLLKAWGDDAGSYRLFRALLDELTSTLGPPTVFVFEDVHWADGATLDLLRFLGTRLRSGRALVVATYRDDGLAPDHPLRVVLGELATQRTTRRIALAPLTREAVSRLADGTSIAGGDLHALTGGNPFLVNEVLDAGVADVPGTARDAVLARVARLSAAAREALEAAAIIGARVEVDVLDRVSGADHAVIDECLTAGALVSDLTSFRFRHEIARRTLEESIAAHRLADLHRRTFVALVATGCTDDARLAHHADGAGDGAAVVHHAVRAAERATERAAHREAVQQYERALRYVDVGEELTRARLSSALGQEAALVDWWETAERAQEEALVLWERLGNQLMVGDTLRRLSRTRWRLCRGDSSQLAAERAVEMLEQFPMSRELGWAYGNLASFRMYRDDEQALTLARKTQEIAREVGDDSLLSHALNTEGSTLNNLDQDGVPKLRESLAVAKSIDDEEQAGRAYANLQAILGSTYRLAEAMELFGEAADYCDDHDIGTYGYCLRGGQACVLDMLGLWDEADGMCTGELARPQLSPINRLSPLTTLGVIRARRCDPDGQRLLDQALAIIPGDLDPAYLELGVACLESAWLVGDLDLAREHAERLEEVVRVMGDEWRRGAYAMWRQRCGLPPVEMGELAPPYATQAAGHWRRAAEQWLEIGCPYLAGLALLDSGETDSIREAIALFDKVGAVATIAVAQAALRRLGETAIPRGRRASTRDDRWGLTRREREILSLLGEGLTNGDIASRLFIAEKTVDNHVASVLAKMGVTSRHDAVRLAESAGDAVPAAM
ncbi:MAG TPA: AAA family ATPase [Mycobacteriales bacterium]|nr:AAA family ATPase [Mycobacteriales bacterium]